jgi:hypothetical protein
MSFGTAPATTGGLNSFGIWSAEDRKKAWQDKQEKEKKEEKGEKEEKKKRLDLRSQLDHAEIMHFHSTVFPLCMICIDLSDSEDSSQTFVEIGKGVTHHLKFKHPKCVPYISTPH